MSIVFNIIRKNEQISLDLLPPHDCRWRTVYPSFSIFRADRIGLNRLPASSKADPGNGLILVLPAAPAGMKFQ